MTHRVCAAFAALVFAGTACSGAPKDIDRVREVLRRADVAPRRVLYTETTQDGTVTVGGDIADGFRYDLIVSLDGKELYEERAVDDALALRVIDPAAAAFFARRMAAPALPGPQAPATLPVGKWVVDGTAAPAALAWGTAKTRRVGDDPVLDAVTVSEFARTAVDEGGGVLLFNPNATGYQRADDPFPTPRPGSAVRRYDVERPPIQAGATGSANEQPPKTANFRKMAVFTESGRVTRISEDIDVAGRLLDLGRVYGTKFPAGRTRPELAQIAVDAINTIRTGQGLEPIRVRTMSVTLEPISVARTVALPSSATTVDLSFVHG